AAAAWTIRRGPVFAPKSTSLAPKSTNPVPFAPLMTSHRARRVLPSDPTYRSTLYRAHSPPCDALVRPSTEDRGTDPSTGLSTPARRGCAEGEDARGPGGPPRGRLSWASISRFTGSSEIGTRKVMAACRLRHSRRHCATQDVGCATQDVLVRSPLLRTWRTMLYRAYSLTCHVATGRRTYAVPVSSQKATRPKN